jgi:hypothetical protein
MSSGGFHRGAAGRRAILSTSPIPVAMPDVRLSPEEAAALRTVLQALVVKRRTGELGIVHGAGRFVSTQRIYRKPELEALQAAARKLGAALGEHDG